MHNLGIVYDDFGRYERAEELYEQALHINEAIGDRYGLGLNLMAPARIALARKDFQKAKTYLTQALSIFEEIESPDVSIIRN